MKRRTKEEAPNVLHIQYTGYPNKVFLNGTLLKFVLMNFIQVRWIEMKLNEGAFKPREFIVS